MFTLKHAAHQMITISYLSKFKPLIDYLFRYYFAPHLFILIWPKI